MSSNCTPKEAPSLYLYNPSHVLPAVFAALVGVLKGEPAHDQYRMRPDEWSACADGCFAAGPASNKTSIPEEKSG